MEEYRSSRHAEGGWLTSKTREPKKVFPPVSFTAFWAIRFRFKLLTPLTVRMFPSIKSSGQNKAKLTVNLSVEVSKAYERQISQNKI